MKTTGHKAKFKYVEPIHLKARVKMLESMLYRLYTGEELSTGQMNELVRIILKVNPNYFEENKHGEI